MVNVNHVWIPQQEWDHWCEMRRQMDREQQIQTGYFLWNNYSMDGYAEWRAKRDVPPTDEVKDPLDQALFEMTKERMVKVINEAKNKDNVQDKSRKKER